MDTELDTFKSQINLTEYASSQGYELIKNESSQNSHVMKNPMTGDKIVVATASDGHGIYFSVQDDSDNGSIIDFVQKRAGLNLGQVRKELRPWIGQSAPVHETYSKPTATTKDAQQVLAVWAKATPSRASEYLQNRGLSPQTIADTRFNFRIDPRGNHYFPHHDRSGLVGFEIKNLGFTGFAKGGEKALFYTTNINTAHTIYFCESAIDCMSLAQMVEDKDTAYVSISGSMSPAQKELLKSLIDKACDRHAEIVMAFDNDMAGERFVHEVYDLIGFEPERKRPREKDWNDDLQQRPTGQHYAPEPF